MRGERQVLSLVIVLVPVEAGLGVCGKRNGELEVVCLGEEWDKKDHRDPDKYAGDYFYRYFKKIIILNTPKSLLRLIFLLCKLYYSGEKIHDFFSKYKQ